MSHKKGDLRYYSNLFHLKGVSTLVGFGDYGEGQSSELRDFTQESTSHICSI